MLEALEDVVLQTSAMESVLEGQGAPHYLPSFCSVCLAVVFTWLLCSLEKVVQRLHVCLDITSPITVLVHLLSALSKGFCKTKPLVSASHCAAPAGLQTRLTASSGVARPIILILNMHCRVWAIAAGLRRASNTGQQYSASLQTAARPGGSRCCCAGQQHPPSHRSPAGQFMPPLCTLTPTLCELLQICLTYESIPVELSRLAGVCLLESQGPHLLPSLPSSSSLLRCQALLQQQLEYNRVPILCYSNVRLERYSKLLTTGVLHLTLLSHALCASWSCLHVLPWCCLR